MRHPQRVQEHVDLGRSAPAQREQHRLAQPVRVQLELEERAAQLVLLRLKDGLLAAEAGECEAPVRGDEGEGAARQLPHAGAFGRLSLFVDDPPGDRQTGVGDRRLEVLGGGNLDGLRACDHSCRGDPGDLPAPRREVLGQEPPVRLDGDVHRRPSLAEDRLLPQPPR